MPFSYTARNSFAFRKCSVFGNDEPVAAGTQSTLIVLDRNALPALITPRLEHEPASARLHPRPKSMSLRAPPVVRLVRSQWHLCTPRKTLNLTHRLRKKQSDSSLKTTNGSATLARFLTPTWTPFEGNQRCCTCFPRLWKLLWKPYPFLCEPIQWIPGKLF